jgi:3-oxoacyl-[acyl-carrier-protein] synthase-3
LREVALEILGTGEYIPGRRIDSAVFDRHWGKPAGWTEDQTGVSSRAFTAPGEDAVSMGAAAAREALTEAGISAQSLDAVIAVGSVPAQAIPCTAAFIHRELGLGDSGIAAFDINATCLGFLVALDIVAQGFATGRYNRVLLVASEVASNGLNWEDPGTAALFGDGSGAVVLGAPRGSGAALRASRLQTFSVGVNHCQVRAFGSRISLREEPDAFRQGSYFEMNGRETYRLAASVLPEFLRGLFAQARIDVEDVSVWVAHQASGRALKHLQRHLRLPEERFASILQDHGNQIAASLPIALHHARRSGMVKSGDTMALIGTGAGLSVGGAVLRY